MLLYIYVWIVRMGAVFMTAFQRDEKNLPLICLRKFWKWNKFWRNNMRSQIARTLFVVRLGFGQFTIGFDCPEPELWRQIHPTQQNDPKHEESDDSNAHDEVKVGPSRLFTISRTQTKVQVQVGVPRGNGPSTRSCHGHCRYRRSGSWPEWMLTDDRNAGHLMDVVSNFWIVWVLPLLPLLLLCLQLVVDSSGGSHRIQRLVCWARPGQHITSWPLRRDWLSFFLFQPKKDQASLYYCCALLSFLSKYTLTHLLISSLLGTDHFCCKVLWIYTSFFQRRRRENWNMIKVYTHFNNVALFL